MLVLYSIDFARKVLGHAFRYYTLWLFLSLLIIIIIIIIIIYIYIQVSQLGTVAQKYQSFTQNATPNVSVPELQNNCKMDLHIAIIL